MQTARRLYIYLLSGIGLGVLVTGVTMLLTVLFEQLGLGPQGDLIGGGDEPIRQQLTLASALTVVALPVWLLHWRVAERSVQPDRPGAQAERTSGVRGLYFAIAMGVLLLAAASGVGTTIESIILRLTGDELDYRGIGSGLALALAAGAAWLYHFRLRTRDWAAGPMTGDGAWLPRAYLYGATFVGLLVLLPAITGAIDLVGRLLLDAPSPFAGPSEARWWAYPLAGAISGMIVGGGIWLGHTAYANRLIADAGWRGASERPALLRLAYFVAVIATTLGTAIYLVADGAGNALAAAFGVLDEPAGDPLIGLIALPVLGAVAYLGAWWYHVRQLRAESAATDVPGRVETGDRLESYPAALVGLGFGAVGLAWVIGLLIDTLLGGGQVLFGGDTMRRELAQFGPIAVVGFGVWAWQWRGVNVRWAVDPAGEAVSTTRRGMLLIVLALSVLAAIVSAGFILYRAFGSVFGISQSADALGELSLPIAGLLVAAGVALYHGTLLRRDQALRARAEQAHPAPAPPASVVLRLTGPAGTDLGATVAALRPHLPPGYALDVATTADAELAPPLPQPSESA